MISSTTRVTASINGSEFYPAEVEFRVDTQMIRSENATKPDPAWEYTDSHGHFHAFAAGGETPTLIKYSVHVDCDGSCGGVCEGEGYDVPAWKCAICADEVAPRFIPDNDARTVGIPLVTGKWAAVALHGQGPLIPIAAEFELTPRRVTVRVQLPEDRGEMVGAGTLGPMSMTYARGGSQWTLPIVGAQLLPRLGTAAERVPA